MSRRLPSLHFGISQKHQWKRHLNKLLTIYPLSISHNMAIWVVRFPNLFQKHLFLEQLTHNMTKDCSLNYEFSTWKLEAQNMLCTQIVFCFCIDNSEQFMYTTCSELVFMYWTRNSINNLLSYFGLVNARISASEKDLPVLGKNKA